MGYRLVEHTADMVVEAEGPDPGTCLAYAATALAALITEQDDPHRIRPDRALALSVEAPDLPALAVAFLSEVLWHLEATDALWLSGGAVVRQEALWRVDAEGNAVGHDPDRHGRGVEIKAVTYHGLVFEQRGKAWFLSVTLDL